MSALVPVEPTADPDVLDRVELLLTELIVDLAPDLDVGSGRGRPRILPAAMLWAGLTVCVLRGWMEQKGLWRLLAGTGLWHYTPVPVSDEAVYKRLAKADPSPMAGLFTTLTTVLTERLTPHADLTLAPHAAEIFAIDQTTLDAVARRLPILREVPVGDARLLPGKLAGVFDVRRQLWCRVEYVADPHQNEKVVARELVAELPRHSLLLFDLGYFAFPWFDDLTDDGFLWVSRLRDKTSYVPLHVFYEDGETRDTLIWLGAYRADKARFAVRLVEFRQGATCHRYLTNVLNPRRLPLADIARLYARRWDIEMAFNLVKTDLHLHLLWSAKPTVILHQIWAVLLIAQLLQALRVLVAATAAVDPFDVSLPLLVRYLPQYAARGHPDPIAAFAADGRRLGFIRPSRRIRIVTPAISPECYRAPPAPLQLVRIPRYAGRRCSRASPSI